MRWGNGGSWVQGGAHQPSQQHCGALLGDRLHLMLSRITIVAWYSGIDFLVYSLDQVITAGVTNTFNVYFFGIQFVNDQTPQD